MLGWLKWNSGRRRTGQQLYERIVAQSRNPSLFEACGVPDTMDGRLEMILLHTVLVLERLRREGSAGQRLGQHLMEALVRDMDDALRRIGLGDDSVSARIPRLAGALQERSRDYGERSGETLQAALLTHVYGGAELSDAGVAEKARLLAAYAERVRSRLAATPGEGLLAAGVAFPDVIAPVSRAREEQR